MRFSCDACSSKYSIADERVKGRILKIRCKACNHIITVREEEKSKSTRLPTPPVPADAGPPVRRSATQDAIDASFGPAASMEEGEHTVVSNNPGLLLDLQRAAEKAPAPPPQAVDEWFVSFDGEQEGPLSLARAKERISVEHAKGRECFGWKAGFFVWLPIEEIPELRDAAKAAKPGNGHHAPPLPLAAAAGEPASKATNGGVINGHTVGGGAGAGGDLPITEASALINLDHLRAAAMNKPAAASGPAVGPTATLEPAEAGSAATPAPVVVVTGPAPRRSSGTVKYIAAAGILLTLGLGGSLAYVLTQRTAPPTPSASADPAARKADDRPIAFFDGTGAPPPAADPKAPIATKKAAPTTAPVAAKAAPAGAAKADPKLSASQKNLASLYAEDGDTTAPRALPSVDRKERGGGQVNQADILSVVTQNKRSLNMCYERVLKRDNTLKRARVVTQVKVGMSGMVTRVTVPDPQYSDSEIGQCLTQAIKKWRFPSSESEYETEFPILLQAE